jgi:c-di-GMP-binding flagellar brake protein YcgR
MNETVIPIEAELTLLRSQLAALQRRRDRRYRCSLATAGKLHFSSTGAVLSGWVFNMSLSGIGLELSEPLPVGQEMVLQLKTTENATVVKKPAQVMHVTPVANGTWRIGCRFEDKLTADALESLL